MSNKSNLIKEDFASTMEALTKLLESYGLSIDNFESQVQDFDTDSSAITLNTKKSASPGILADEALTTPQLLSSISSVLDSYLESCLEMSFFKDYKKVCIEGELHPLPDANNTSATRENFKALLAPYVKKPLSFLNYINRVIKKHIMTCLLVELTFKYDCYESLEGNTSETDEHKISISDFFSTYKDLTNGDPNISASRTSAWRLQNNFHSFFALCQSIRFNDDARRLLAQQKEYHDKGLANHPDSNFRYDYCKVFSLGDYASLNLIFAPLACDTEDLPSTFPLSFVAYIGFVVHQFSKARNLYSHCETYKRNLDTGKTHNIGRDFSHIQNKYNDYIDEVNIVLQNMLITNHALNSEPLCAEFLLDKAILHHRFFASLDCDIFHYLAGKIDTSSSDGNDTTSNHYYTALKMLWYFNIDLKDLYDCAFSPEEFFICEALDSITDSDNPLSMPLDFLCDYLKEIYYTRGEFLAEGISIINSLFNELEPSMLRERINGLSNYICNNFKSSKSVITNPIRERTSLARVTFDSFSDKELQLITHLLHLSGTEDLVL